MKIGVFSSLRHNPEKFRLSAQRYGDALEFVEFPFLPTEENADKIVGCQALMLTPNNKITSDFLSQMKAQGVQYLLTSSTGYDHFDLEMLKSYGLKAARVAQYSPNAISEHAVLLLLSVLRKLRGQLRNIENKDFSVMTAWGKEIHAMEIGVVGTGRIGYTTLKCLSGFEPKGLYAFDLYQNDQVKQYAQYLSLEELYKRCDVLIFHCNYDENNHHMIREETLSQMKDGVVLINAARGPLFDTEALVAGMERGKIGGLGLDVLEEEATLFQWDGKGPCPVPAMEALLTHSNVVYTTHSAFRTETAAADMIATTVDNAYEYATTGECCNEVVR